MRKYLLPFALLAMLFAFVACESDDNEDWIEPQFDTESIYVLNEGRWNEGDGNLSFYNLEKEEISEEVFYRQNNIKLGELPNAIHKSLSTDRLFILAFGSNKIFVTDLAGKLIANGIIDFDGKEYTQPRNIVELNGKLYVNFYSGHLAQIDATTLMVDKFIAIEKNTEQMTIASNGKLYIANSGGGEGKTVTVVDLSEFKIETTINVPLNPYSITSDAIGNVYVASQGRSWGDNQVAAELSRIDTKNSNTVHSIGKDIATRMAVLDGKLLLFYTYYEGVTPHTTYSYYDIYKNKHIAESFITIPSTTEDAAINHAVMLDKAYSITVDPLKKDIYITISNYDTSGYVYIFSQNGNYKTSFTSGGINPNSVVFVTKQVEE